MSTRFRAAALALALCVSAVPRPSSAQSATSLTPADYMEIEQLVHRLHFALDYCASGGRDFADLFVPGGQYVIDAGDGKPKVVSTREQLVALAGGPGCEAVRTPPRSYIAHAAENLVIAPIPGGARGVSYAIYPATEGRYLQPDVAGQVGLYFDEYVRTDHGWRFKSRRHVQKLERGGTSPLQWLDQSRNR